MIKKGDTMSYGYDYETKERFLSDIKKHFFPILTKTELKRKQSYLIYMFVFPAITLCMIILSICIHFFQINTSILNYEQLMFACILGGISFLAFSYIKLLNSTIVLSTSEVNELLKYYGSIQKEERNLLSETGINPPALFPVGKYEEYNCFSGVFKNITFSFENIHVSITRYINRNGKISKEQKTVFSGVLIKIPLSDIIGQTIITSQYYDGELGMIPHINGMSQEDVVYTDSKEEALSIITPDFIGKYNTIKEFLNSKDVRIAFADNCMILTYQTYTNLSLYFSLSESLISTENYESFYDQIIQIYKIIEILDIQQ